MNRRSAVSLCLLLAAFLLLLPAAAGGKKKKRKLSPTDHLPQQYQQWLEDVELIISYEEHELFVALEKDYQRDAFIERFWKVRDNYPRTARNEFKEEWEARLQQLEVAFPEGFDERAEIFMVNGPPLDRFEINCTPYLWPTEVWYYEGSDKVGWTFILLFYQNWGRGPFKLWEPFDGADRLIREPGIGLRDIETKCGPEKGRAILAAISFLNSQGGTLGAATLLADLRKKPAAPQPEWVATFSTYSTDVPEGASTFPGRLEVGYPGRHQSRSVMQGTVWVKPEDLGQSTLTEQPSYNLLLGGELLREGKLFENFRYRYDLPAGDEGEELPLVFQRYLRPGEYNLVVKVEDLNGGRYHRSEQAITVPLLDKAPPPPADPETARLLAEANAAIRDGESTIKLVQPHGQWQTGLVRLNTLVTGDGIRKATFFLDGQAVLSKRRPPYSVELDLGNVPSARVLRVEGYDGEGEQVASDEMTLNAGKHRFAVRLVEPQKGGTYASSLRAQAEVLLPEGEITDRVEFFLNETRVATVYQPPYIQPIVLGGDGEVAYVRAVAYTPDGNMTEDTVFVNFPGYVEDVDIDFVELYTTVLDRSKRPVEGLTLADFTVFEDDQPQDVTRFEQVRNLPIHAAVMLDVSASMEGRLEQARAAALRFFEQAVTPKDRAAIITFNDHPNLAAKFTNDVDDLAAGLAGLKAERGTALYDSLVFTLYYFNGITGQRALLLLSDGKDESSLHDFDTALEFANRSGVSIYSIGLALPRKDGEARRKLSKLAEETGGRSFFIEEVAELDAVYEAIQRELRSRYLLAYQSSNISGDKRFRVIRVKMEKSGLDAKTLRGYFP